MQTTINKDMSNVSNWLKANTLSLYVRTHYIIFTKNRHIDTDIIWLIDGESMCEIQKTKFRGVVIDDKFTW